MVSNPYVKVATKNAGTTGAPAALSYTATLTSADPNATGETTKTVVFARAISGANSSKALTTAQQNLIKSLGLSLTGPAINANVYERLKENKDVILINADSSDEDIRAAVAFAQGDPLNYRARLLAKFKAEALAANPNLSAAELDTTAQSSLEALARKMGQSSVDAYIKAFYNTYQKTTTAGVGAIAQGAKAIAMEDGAVAIGTAASAMSKESLALGVATVTTGERAIGVGSLAVASGDRSVAIGTYTNRPDSTLGETRYDAPRALGDDAVAIGAGAYVGVDVLGTKSVALGAGSIVTTSYGDLKENLTTGAWEGTLRNYKSYDPNKTPGVNADGETDKQFTRGNTTTGGSTGTVDKAYVGRLIYRDFAGATAVGAVSVGYAGAEKRIQNVAAGEISPTSTDAINGSQLYIATYELGYQIESSHFHTNDGTGTQEEGNTVTNKGKLAETAGARSKYATTAGVAARAVGEAAVAVGHNTLTGLTEKQYAGMVLIDEKLARHKADRQKAQDKLEAAEKTLSLARSRLPILNAELANYAQGLVDLERKIKEATGNLDELARLTEQRTKMLASQQLIKEQHDKLVADQAQANTDKQASEAEIATLDDKISDAKDQLADFLRANAKDHAVALGSSIEASGEKSVAIGKDVKVSGNQSIAVGYGNVVSGNNSGAFGDPSIVAGAGSYTQGNDNAVGSQAKNVGAFGNNNQIGATATYVDGKLQTANGLTKESAVENSRVVGNNNYINTNNTYVLGSGVGVEGADHFGTVENSVYLGNDSTAVATAGKNKTKANADGTTTTGGATGTVTNAELFGVTYGNFAGATAKGAVTVGSAGEEHRIMNVAAGEISNTSTDAINGSQLYYVAKQAATPFTVTANSNKDTDAKNLDKQYAAADGKQVQLGETLNIAGSKTSKSLTRDDSGAATDSTYSAKNIQTIVDDNGVQIQMAEKPEFKELTVKADDSDSNPVKITSGTGNTGGTISNLSTTLPDNSAQTAGTKPTSPTTTNAATLGDVLNAGFNLQAQDQAIDFVKPYDTVNIKGDGAVKVAGTNTDGATSTVTISVETTTLKDEKKAGDNNTLVDGKDGKVDAPAEGDKNKLVTAENIANAINNSGFTLKSSAVENQGEKLTGTQTGDEVINPGDVIEMVAGKNMAVKQDQNGKITYATKDNVEFNTVKVGTTGTGTDTKKPVELKTENAKPATNNPDTNKPTTALDIKSTDGKPTQITGVGSVLNTQDINVDKDGNKENGTPAGSEKLVNLNGTEQAPVNKNAAATVGDLQNMGWVVKATGNAYSDVVKNANEVNFVGTNLAKVTGETKEGIRTITVDVNAQKTVEAADTPVVYTDADGNKLVKGEDGNFYPAGSLDNLVFNPKDKKYYPAGTTFNDQGVANNNVQPSTLTPASNVIASMNDGDNTANTPKQLANVKGNLAPTYNKGDKQENADKRLGDTVVSTATTNVTAPTDVKSIYNNAATVGDVLNAGWNLQGNGVAKDFVKPYDTVNFVNGTGTTVDVTTDADGKVSNVKVNTLLAPTNLNGDVLVKGNDNNWYIASEVTNGVPKNGATVQNAPTSVKVVNPADNTTSNPTKLGNVASSLNMKQVSTNPTGSTANPVPSENKELLNLEGTTDAPVNKNAAATVGDLQNMGWVVRAQGNGYSDVVKNANEVEFRGEGIEVNGKTEEGKRVITIKPLAQVLTKLEAELVNNTGGIGTTEPSGKITIAPNNNAGGFATAGNVKDMINAAGWRVQENGTTKDLVKAGDKVNFVNGAGTTVSVTTADGGESSDVKVNIDTTTLINKDGKVVEPVTNAANFVKAIEDAKKELADAQTEEAKAEANRKLAEAEKAADTAGLNKVVTAQNVAEAINKSGFTLKTSANGGEKISGDDELINPGDKVEMVAGKNLTVKQEANGKVTYATKDDVNFTTASIGKETFVTKDTPAKEVVKIGGKYYEKGVVEKDGKVYPAGTDLTQVNDATPQASEIAADNVKLKDPTVNFERVDGRDTTHTPAGENAQPTTTNVDSALSVKDSNGNNSQINGIASALDTKEVATKPLTVDADGNPVADKQTGKKTLVDLTAPTDAAEKAKWESSAVTVGDIANMGWIVSATGNDYKDTVKNANQVDFVGTGLAKVTGETKNGIRTITVNVDAQKTVEAAQTPVVYTNENGEKLVKGEDGKFYKPADLEGATYDKTANKYTKDNADVAPATTVIASMNDGNNRTTTPMVLSNVDGNLAPTYNKDDATETNGKLGDTTADAPTKSQTAPTAENVKKMYNNAATVGDVLNAGWNLQGNGEAKDFVKPYDTVNFVDGAGTKVDVSTDADGKVSTVKVNVDTVGLTNNANGGVENPTKAAQEALDAAQKALDEANAGTDEAAKEAAAKDVQAAQKALDKANNQIATAQDVANAINNSGWNVIAEANGGVVSGSNKELVKPSETVSLKAGKNIEIAQEGQNFTFRTSANPEFNSVTVGEPAYQKADGTPVNKVGDKYYAADGQEVAAGDVVKATKPAVNMTAEAAKPATNNGNNPPSTALNITSADGKPTQITGVGSSLNTKAITTSPTGNGGTTENIDLVDLVGTDTAPINKNAAATVGDLANMGWVVSATGNGYKDAVKNANQVDFVGTGLATVKGETNATTGIRTITVDVNAQNTVESAQTPVVYTDANGNKVTKADDGNFYPADSVVIDGKRYPKGSVKNDAGNIVDANGQAVAELQPIAKGDIIASMNNGDNATKPTALSNVGSNLTPTTSGDTLINTDGTTTAGQTPTKVAKAPTNAAKMNNNAATVGDVLNAGWNLQGNGSAVDFVKPYDTVNFVDGVGTLVKATSNGTTSVIQVDVDKGSINVNTTTGAVTPTNLTALDKAIADATKALDDAKAANPTDPNAQAIKDAEVALAKAEADKAKVLNKVATVEDVASALKNSGFTLKSSAVDTGTKLSGDDELINPGDTVEMVAGKNLTVKQEVNGKITYATKDDVNFNSVEVGKAEPTYKDKDGDELVKVGDNFYKKDDYTAAPDKADGTGKDLTNVDTATVDNAKSEAPVKLTSDKGVATKETTLGTDGKTETTTAKDAPSALSVKDSLGENSQINGIASALDTKEVATKPLTVDADGNPVADKQTGKDKLVDLTAPTDPDTKAKWESSAVTVGDIANMGWVVSASDNGYTDTVKNANKVDFKGENGISVTGKTTADGIREITVSLEKGEVIGANEGTVKIDGKDTDVVKVGDEYFKKEDIDPTTGKPKEGTTALGNDVVGNNGENVVNNGNKLVDGHTVAKAIQESGFTVGKETDTSGVDFNNSDEKVNPNDELRFADGKGTTVSTGTVKTIDPNGEVSTKTVVKVDVDTGVITNNANGSLKGIVSAADAKKLNDDLAKAQDALAAIEKLGENAPQNVKDAAKAAVYDAEKAIEKAGLNKVATVQNVADAINQSGWNAAVANVGSGVSVDKGGDALVNPGDTVTMTAGNNMQITKDGLNYTIETQKDVTFNSVTADAVNIGPVTLTGRVAHNPDGSTTNELSVGSPSSPTRITNVAPGVNDTDAVNVSQLKGVQNNINQRFGDVYQKMDREHKGLRAGIAGAAALAGIPEVHVAGRSMIAAAASAYKSENAVAVGYSRLSDNSKIKLKLTGSANSRGDVMGTVGVGYMW